MYNIKKITEFLNEFLTTEDVTDEFYDNGLIVSGRERVKRIGFAVEPSTNTIRKAINNKVEMLITHNGLIFKKSPLRIKGNLKRKIHEIIKHNINIYVAHLTMDLNEDVSSNTLVLERLGAEYIGNFGPFSREFGSFGELKKEMSMDNIVRRFKERISKNIIALNYGTNNIKSIAVCAPPMHEVIYEASDFDVLITTNINPQNYAEAKDYDMNVIFVSEYEIDKFGIFALMEVIGNKFPELDLIFLEEENYLKIRE